MYLGGDYYRPAACLVDRIGAMVRVRVGNKWQVYTQHLNTYDSMLSEIGDPIATPEIHKIRHIIRSWRFYDQFRTDAHSIIKIPKSAHALPYWITTATTWWRRCAPFMKLAIGRLCLNP